MTPLFTAIKISSGQKTYSIDTRSFLFNKQFKHFSEQLCAGAIIYVETKNDTMEQLHLTGIDINFDEKSTNFTLGNKYDRSDLKALYEDALGQNSKSFTELRYIASIIEDQQKQLDYQRNWVADLRTLTLDNVLTSEDQAIEINNRGLIGRKRRLDENGKWDFDENGNPYFEDEQVKLIHNSLIFTRNNWESADAAFGKIAVGYNADGSVKYDYGMNGRVIIGELFLGNNLVLTGTSAGIKIKDSSGNDVFYADENGNLILSGTIYAKAGQIGGWSLELNSLMNSPIANVTERNVVGMSPGILFNDKGEASLPTHYTDRALCFWAGAPVRVEDNKYWHGRPNEALFRVYRDGYLCALSANIGNFTVRQNGFGDISREGTSGSGIWFEPNPSVGNHFIYCVNYGDSSKYFRVRQDGVVFASGVDISGTINARNGRIGDWYISDNKLQYGDFSDANSLIFIAPDQEAWSSWWGTKNWILYLKSKFGVDTDGNLYATGATITGTINATSGSFSNCTINKTCTIKKVEADEGYIGGWNILDGWIKGTDVGYSKTTLITAQYISRYYINGSGGGSVYWERIFDHIGIDTSDIRYKKNIEKMSDDYDVFFDLLNPVRYKYKDGNSGRYHTGFIAQEVVDSLEKSNLDTEQFAAVCLDKPANGDECWFLRRDEFVALNTWQIQKAKSRITELENKVAELETQIQTLTAG